MKNKTLEFVKNGMYATIPFIAGGIAGAELSDLVTDSPAVISIVSTIGQYILGYPAFMAFHARDNPDDYKINDRWNSKKLVKGLGKTILSLLIKFLKSLSFTLLFFVIIFLFLTISNTYARSFDLSIAPCIFLAVSLFLSKNAEAIDSIMVLSLMPILRFPISVLTR